MLSVWLTLVFKAHLSFTYSKKLHLEPPFPCWARWSELSRSQLSPPAIFLFLYLSLRCMGKELCLFISVYITSSTTPDTQTTLSKYSLRERVATAPYYPLVRFRATVSKWF